MEIETAQKVKYREHNLAKYLLSNYTDQIFFIESDGLQTYLVLADNSRVETDLMLHEIEASLPNNNFVRCGWSFIVNLDFVDEVTTIQFPVAVMRNGEIIPIPEYEAINIKAKVIKRRLSTAS